MTDQQHHMEGAMPHDIDECPTRRASLAVVGGMLLLPLASYAQQQATLIGTVTDSTGAVLPGVTVTATHEASGNTFVAVARSTSLSRS